MPRHHSRLQHCLTSAGCLYDTGMCTVQQGLLLICAKLPALQQGHDIPNTSWHITGRKQGSQAVRHQVATPEVARCPCAGMPAQMQPLHFFRHQAKASNSGYNG